MPAGLNLGFGKIPYTLEPAHGLFCLESVGVVFATTGAQVGVAITSASPLFGGQQSVPYNVTIAATGGIPPYTWSSSVVIGTNTYSINPSTGALTGLPLNVETDSVSVTVTDSTTPTPTQSTKTFSIAISPTLAQTPVASPAAGTYGSSQSVTLSDATAGAVIYYTLDGSTPTTSSSVYSTPLLISSTKILNYIATAPGYSTSAVGSSLYSITGSQVATPTFSPAGGTYSGAQSVTPSCATAGASIFYTTNGTTPTPSSTPYTGTPINVTASETVQALATLAGFANSAVGSASYTIGAVVYNQRLPYTGTLTISGGAFSNGTQKGLLMGGNVGGTANSSAQAQANDWADGGYSVPPTYQYGYNGWNHNVVRLQLNAASWLGLTCAVLTTQSVTFTAAPTFGSTSGQLIGNWTLPSGSYGMYFGGSPFTTATFTQNSPNVTWSTLDVSGNNASASTATASVNIVSTTRNADYHGTYKSSIDNAIAQFQSVGCYVILDLHWSAPQIVIGTTTYYLMPLGQPQMANANTDIAFWTSIAQRYGNNVSPPLAGISNAGIAFELFNEPYLSYNPYKLTTTSGGSTSVTADAAVWSTTAWCSGLVNTSGQGTYVIPVSWQTTNHQAMLNAVRATGATNVCLVSGNSYTQELQHALTNMPTDSANQLGFTWHCYGQGTYPYLDGDVWPLIGRDSGSGTSASLQWGAALTAAGYALISTEDGGGAGTAATSSEPHLSRMNLFADTYGMSRVNWEWGNTRAYGYAGPLSGSDGPFLTGFASDNSTILPLTGAGQVQFDWQRKHAGSQLISRDCSVPCIPYTSSGTAANLTSADYTVNWRSSQGVPSPTNIVKEMYDVSWNTANGTTQIKMVWYAPGNPNFDGYADGNSPFYNGPGTYTVVTNTAPGGTSPPTTGWVTVATRTGITAPGTISLNTLEDLVTVNSTINWIGRFYSGGNGSSGNSDIAIKADIYDNTFCTTNGGIASDLSYFFLGDSIDEQAMNLQGLGDGVNPSVACLSFGEICRTGGFIASSTLTNGGTGYTPGTYNTIILAGGTGANAVATIVVSSAGVVTSVTGLGPLNAMGYGYKIGDVLTVPNTYIGGTGSGASLTVTQIAGWPTPINGLGVGGYNHAGFTPRQVPGGQGGWTAANWNTYVTTNYTNIFTTDFVGKYVVIKLGTNSSGTASQFVSAIGPVIAAAQAAGKTVYLDYPPNSPNNTWVGSYIAQYPTLQASYPGLLLGYNMYVLPLNFVDGTHPTTNGRVAIRVGRATFYSFN